MLHHPHHIRAFTLFCLFGAILSVIRVCITGTTEYMGFVWNLILALLPYFFAGFAVQKNGILHYGNVFLWFIFFPNSLYLWTDFVHLGEHPEMLHFDIVYISVMAIAGIICGFASLEILHTYWNQKFHKKITWTLVSLSMIFGIYGVYIGRFLRLNSWDLIDSPLLVLREIWMMTITNGGSLIITESHRIAEATRYSAGMTSLSTFLILYFSLFMIFYVSLYHIRRAR
ncbi:DUF1361 domain-containing protein [Candidatus Gracilibacteria bacterium]|nr:DUF1361 domain-containing protein [Candidatus Gracilibacteria bacterium]